jgi:ribosome maturation factor RimP
VLLRREEDMVLLDIDGKDFAVPMSAIEVARLVPDLSGGARAS